MFEGPILNKIFIVFYGGGSQTAYDKYHEYKCSTLLVIHDYNKVWYLLYSHFTITTRFVTCCTRKWRLQQGLLLAVLVFHDYNNVRYLLYSCFTITTMFGTCGTRVSRLQQGSLLVVLENDDYNKVRYLLYSKMTITTRFGTCRTCWLLHDYHDDNTRYYLWQVRYLSCAVSETSLQKAAPFCFSLCLCTAWELSAPKRSLVMVL